jgi:hypothetical protein
MMLVKITYTEDNSGLKSMFVNIHHVIAVYPHGELFAITFGSPIGTIYGVTKSSGEQLLKAMRVWEEEFEVPPNLDLA